MSIDRKRFSYWMGVIGDRCNRALSSETYAEYYRTLDAALDDDLFDRAARSVFKTSEFWPSPQAFIDAVRPNTALTAASVFDDIRGLAHRAVTAQYWIADDILKKCGSHGLVAFRAIGGGERFGQMDARDLPFARREFVEAYKAAVSADDKNQPLLAWLDKPRLAAGATS